MRLRDVLVQATVISLVMVSVNQKTAAHAEDELTRTTRLHGPVKPVPLPVLKGDSVIRSAYYDTLAILSETNSCTDFFGGSAKAVEVFNKFLERVKKDYLKSAVGMRMSGGPVNYLNIQTNTSYRLFDKVLVNTNGPFYRRKVSSTQAHVPGVGSFQANSREVRVLMLLHELGHLMKGSDGKWLLPDDGYDEHVSRKNSEKIEAVCGDEIRDPGRNNDGANFTKNATARNKLAPSDK